MLKILQKPEQPPLERQGTRMIYLICDEPDRPATIPLRKFLKELGNTTSENSTLRR